MYHAVRKKKMYQAVRKKILHYTSEKMAYRPAKVHVSSKKKKKKLLHYIWMKDKADITIETLAALPMSNIIRMAAVKVDQGGNKSNNVCSLSSRISKISDKISRKNQPTEIF